MKTKRFLLIVVCFWTLVGCTKSPLVTRESGDFSGQYQIITPINVNSLVEILFLPAVSEKNSVKGINFAPSTNNLITVLSPSGRTIVWDVQSQKVLQEFSTYITSSKRVSIDSGGNYIIGSIYSEFKDDDFFYKEYLGGVGIWNAYTGDLTICIEATCDVMQERKDREPIFALSSPIGYTIAPKGDWALVYGMRFIRYVNLNTEKISSITYGTQKGENLKLIGNVAFDYQGGRIAIAYQEGGLEIKNFPFSSLDIFSTTLQDSQEINLHSPVDDLSFSPDNKWIARLFQNKVTVWNLEKNQQDAFINESMPNAKFLSFDPSSNLLV